MLALCFNPSSLTYSISGPTTTTKLVEVLTCLHTYVQHSVATNLKKLNALQFTPLMEQYCADLEASGEEGLALMVRTQRLAEKMMLHAPTPASLSTSSSAPAPVPSLSSLSPYSSSSSYSSALPPSLYVSAFEAELAAVGGPCTGFLGMQHEHLRTFLYEPFLQMHMHQCAPTATVPTSSSSSSSSSTAPAPTPHLPTAIESVTYLHACLNAAQAYLAIFLAQPVESYYDAVFVEWTQMTYVLAVVARLALLHVPGWDLAYVRATVDVVGLLTIIQEHILECACEGYSEDGSALLARMVERVRVWYETEVAKDAVPGPSIGAGATLGGGDGSSAGAGAGAGDGDGGSGGLDSAPVSGSGEDVSRSVLDAVEDDEFWRDFLNGVAYF